MALTVKQVAKLTTPGRYGDGHGLYLQVLSATNRSWLLRFERSGRERWLGLGPLHTFTLEEARERARNARRQLYEGIDPIEHRRAEGRARALAMAKALTFEQAARMYFDAHERKWRNAKHRAQFLSTLQTYASPKIGKLSVADIDTGLVLKIAEPICRPRETKTSRTRHPAFAAGLKVCWIGLPSGSYPERRQSRPLEGAPHAREVLPARRLHSRRPNTMQRWRLPNCLSLWPF